jgi:hypothetical protein
VALSYTTVTATQATASSGVASSTTAFSPTAGQMVAVVWTYMLSTNATGLTFTVADSNSNTYANAVTWSSSMGAGYSGVSIFQYPSGASGITVKVTASGTGAADCLITPFLFSGQSTNQSGAATNTASPSGTITSLTCAVTPTATGSYVIAAGQANGAITFSAGANTTQISAWDASGVGEAGCSGASTATQTSGVSYTAAFTITGSDTFGGGIAVAEILPAASSSGAQGFPVIQPGPTWLDTFKPGLPKPRPFAPFYLGTEQGPFSVVLPTLTTSLTAQVVLPLDQPSIQPGPTWLDTFKPGMPKPRPPFPQVLSLTGEFGPFSVVLPTLAASLTGQAVLPLSQPSIQPGPTWLDNFKPGFPRARPIVPPFPPTKLAAGPFATVLPRPAAVITGSKVRTPENLGAVLTLPGPAAVQVIPAEGAAFTLPDYGATLVLANLGGSLTGWTMQTAPLNLLEFNDVTIDIAVTQNGSPYNLTGVTVNLLFKSVAGTPDSNALVFSSSGGSPAITVTNASGGLAVATIPNTDLDAEIYGFYRLDVVNGGLTNTALSGPVTWTSL